MFIGGLMRLNCSTIVLLLFISILTGFYSIHGYSSNRISVSQRKLNEWDGNEPTSYPLHLIDDYGRNVTFEEEPQRIISIAPSATEVIYAVGAGEKLIGVDPNSNYPKETEILPKVTNFPSVDIEAIIVLNPDAIFGAGITSSDDVESLESLGITVFILAPFNVEDILGNIETVGIITNHLTEARDLKNSLQQRIDTVKQEAALNTVRPKIYIETYSEPLYTFGKGTYGHDLIELAGATNIAENATGLYPQINDEFVITTNPDIIFYTNGSWTTITPPLISNRTGWNSINAVKNGHIYPINEDWISRGGPRIVNALEEIHSKVKLVVSSSTTDTNITSAFGWSFLFVLLPVFIVFVLKRRRIYHQK